MDQCIRCDRYGDFGKCQVTPCYYRELWVVSCLRNIIKEMEYSLSQIILIGTAGSDAVAAATKMERLARDMLKKTLEERLSDSLSSSY